MDRELQIRKTVANKTQFTKIVDNRFSTFTQPQGDIDVDTVDELFRLYDKLYFEIDLTGDFQSHEYLIRKSSELVNIEQSTEDIQPLLDEISQLRTQLLEANRQILELESSRD